MFRRGALYGKLFAEGRKVQQSVIVLAQVEESVLQFGNAANGELRSKVAPDGFAKAIFADNALAIGAWYSLAWRSRRP